MRLQQISTDFSLIASSYDGGISKWHNNSLEFVRYSFETLPRYGKTVCS